MDIHQQGCERGVAFYNESISHDNYFGVVIHPDHKISLLLKPETQLSQKIESGYNSRVKGCEPVTIKDKQFFLIPAKVLNKDKKFFIPTLPQFLTSWLMSSDPKHLSSSEMQAAVDASKRTAAEKIIRSVAEETTRRIELGEILLVNVDTHLEQALGPDAHWEIINACLVPLNDEHQKEFFSTLPTELRNALIACNRALPPLSPATERGRP